MVDTTLGAICSSCRRGDISDKKQAAKPPRKSRVSIRLGDHGKKADRNAGSRNTNRSSNARKKG